MTLWLCKEDLDIVLRTLTFHQGKALDLEKELLIIKGGGLSGDSGMWEWTQGHFSLSLFPIDLHSSGTPGEKYCAK